MRTKISLTVGIILLLVSFNLGAKSLTTASANYRLAERFSPTKIKKMVFSTSVYPKWLKTGDKFWYKYKTSQGLSTYIVDLNKNNKSLLYDNHKMATMLTNIVKDPYDWQHLPRITPKFMKNDKVFQFDVTSSQLEIITDSVDLAKVDSLTLDVKDSLSIVKNDTIVKKKKVKKKKTPKKKIFHLEYNIKTGVLSENKDWKEEIKTPRWANISPDTNFVIFARNYNLYWMDRENYEKAKQNEFDIKKDKDVEVDSTVVEHKLTTDGVRYFSYGGGFTYDENSNYDEKKIKKEKKKRRGAWVVWSKDSKKFALTKNDSRKVKNLWVVDVLNSPRPKLETYKYHMPGEQENVISQLWVFDMTTKKGVKIDTKKFAQERLSIHYAPKTHKELLEKDSPYTWLSETSDKLYYTRLSRDMHKEDFCVADTKTGKTTVLIEERENTYIDSKSIRIVNNGKEIIKWSERDGWAHLYLFDKNGKLKNQITSGAWHCSNIIDVDAKKRVIYFTANGRETSQNNKSVKSTSENPYYSHLYKVNFNGTGLKLLNKGNFDSRIVLSDSKKFFINNFSRVNTTPKSVVINTKGKTVLDLETADLQNLFAAGYKFPEPFQVKANDGITDLYGVIYKPFDFHPLKKYPIIEYVYPGPQTEAVNTIFSSYMDNVDRLAQLGFIVISVGNRGGHPNRSKWYHNYGYGNLRDYGLADKKYVVEQLADKYNFIDIDRVGITGHSGGGFMSTAALCQYPDFFKVAVSSAGNHENNIYNSWWSEKHHGIKEEINKKGESKFIFDIEKNSQLAKNLKGKLLLVTGDIDNNVHPGNTIRMANALMKANKRFDFFIMPGKRHGFGAFREYFFWLKADYFCKHLIGDYSISTDIFEMRRERKVTSSKNQK